MEDPKEVDDTLYIVDATSRQSGRVSAVKEWIAALEAQGKKVVVIGMDSPRPPLLGALMAPIGDPDLDAVDVFRSQHPHLLKATEPTFLRRPFAGKTTTLHSFKRDEQGQWVSPFFQPWDTEILPLPITLKSFGEAAIPTQVKKPDWREDRMAFLNGIAGKKKHQK